MVQGSSRRLQMKHQRLWADEVIGLQYPLLALNEIRALQATNQDNVVKFHGIVVHHPLENKELDDLRMPASSNRAPFVPGGTAARS